MSAHVLLNFFNELGKRVKMQGLSSIFIAFCNKFKKFNDKLAQMLDSMYLITSRLLKNRIFGVTAFRFCHLLHNIMMDIIM